VPKRLITAKPGVSIESAVVELAASSGWLGIIIAPDGRTPPTKARVIQLMADGFSASDEAGIGARRSATESCWLCGAWLHKQQLMPDGGPACADVRWYCRDLRTCTQRWTSSQSHGLPADVDATRQAAASI